MSTLPEESGTGDAYADDQGDHAIHRAQLTAALEDPAAFAPLYERYKADIYYYCFRRLGHPEEAADATSQIFVKVLRALPTYRIAPAHSGSAFRAWLYSIAQTTVIDLHRRRRPMDSLDTDGMVDWPVVAPDATHVIEDELVLGEDRRFVLGLLQRLPERQRRIMDLRLAGLSGQEIAEAMDVTLSAVKSAQFRAVRTLRRLKEGARSEQEGRRGE